MHVETKQVAYYNGHVIEVDGRRYAPERTCRKLPPFDPSGRYTLTAKYASGFEYSKTLAYVRCSKCGTHFCDDFAYCPYCGAKAVE